MRFLLILHLIHLYVMSNVGFLRRGRNKPSRSDAFEALFGTLGALYEGASNMKSEWRDVWIARKRERLPAKYDFGNELCLTASYDMRYATFLLQRYRWKSLVRPLFAEHDPQAWANFQNIASTMSTSLLIVGDEYIEQFFEDERDWIQSAIEQFDDARRTLTNGARNGASPARQIAEGTYLPLYIAIQLSDRFIERLRFEAGKVD